MFLPLIGCCTCGATNLYELGREYKNETGFTLRYHSDLEDKENLTKAAICFKKAADKGHLDATFELANILLEGKLIADGFKYFDPNSRAVGPWPDVERLGRNLMYKAAQKGHSEAIKIMKTLDAELKIKRDKRSEEQRKIIEQNLRYQEECKQSRLEYHERQSENARRQKEYEMAHPEIPLLRRQNELLLALVQKP